MARDTVEVTRRLPQGPAPVWAVLRGFVHRWHPDVQWCNRALDRDGALLREFGGSDGEIYRERLTYLSDTDRRLSYLSVRGIEGVRSYAAQVGVETAPDGGALVRWRAEIDAEPQRLADLRVVEARLAAHVGPQVAADALGLEVGRELHGVVAAAGHEQGLHPVQPDDRRAVDA